MTKRRQTSLRLALVSAVAGVLVIMVTYTIAALLTGSFSVVVLVASVILPGIGIYTITRLISERLVFDRLKQIYRTLYFLNPAGHETESDNRADLLDETGQRVETWAKDRKEEMDRIKQLAEYRRDFLGNVSHELRTPIFNIQGYVLTLLDGGLEDQRINREYLKRTERSVNRMITIVDDLEAIAKMESGELELKLAEFDIVSLTREVLEFLEIKARKKHARIFFEGKYDKAMMVRADRERIREVLINLVDNSIKYRKKETDSTVGIAYHDMDDHYLIEVTDNGIGMSDQDIARIFERFFRTEEGRLRSHSGSGLGLAIVKHVIEAHKEKISVRSKSNEGTTFGFTLRKAGR